MGGVFEDMFAAAVAAGADPKKGALGRALRSNGVANSQDYERILGLPRTPGERPELALLARALNEDLKTAKGSMTLRPIQVRALEAIHDLGGLLAPIRVGGGKTLLSLLASNMLPVKRPLLLIPADLRSKTIREAQELRLHWRFQMPKIVSYQELSHPDHDKDLEELYVPDLIICDEAHCLRNRDTAVQRRVARYMKARPQTHFVAMSGTITARSIKDYSHLSRWALGDEAAPVPVEFQALEEWSAALDAEVPESKRMQPGVLRGFMNEEEKRFGDTTAARRAYARRLTQSYGVVASGDVQVACDLNIHTAEVEYPPEVDEAFSKMISTWETPDGWPITEGAQLWRHARELSCGFYYVWNPRPPSEWLEARKAWASECRRIIKDNRQAIDTEAQVKRAIDTGTLSLRVQGYAGICLAEWRDIEPSFIPNVEPRWLSDVVVNAATAWAHDTGGIVWTEHVAFARRLEAISGLPYHGSQGLDRNGVEIELAKGPVIASIASNHKGRNLQYKWSDSWVSSCTPKGALWEQLLGRMHRDGQRAKSVDFHVLCGCIQAWAGFEKARSDANYIEQSTLQNQKLNYASVDWPTADEIAAREGPRWQK